VKRYPLSAIRCPLPAARYSSPRRLMLSLAFLLPVVGLSAQKILVPMDDAQQNHLKAYGVTFSALKDGLEAEWLLNYRGGSFLLPDVPELRRRAGLEGVTVEPIDGAGVSAIRSELASANMDAVMLERAPKIAVYTPPNAAPWDDAVTLALRYAGIPYDTVWDAEVVRGDLSRYDWLHLHHEDFTGQLSKFHSSYRGAPWFTAMLNENQQMATRLGFPTIPALKKGVADRIRQFVEQGGFLFAMCGATETLELAIAGRDVDIAQSYADGTPMDPAADSKMAWDRALAIANGRVEPSPLVSSQSDIDGHQVNVPGRRQPLGSFTLFGFAAKFDPVASMLVQNHRAVLPDYYGVTTSFMKAALKPSVTVLAFEEGAPWVKYVHGDYGKGTWTYLGGHDPEDPQHAIGNPPTDLSLHPNSPGYRLILNNVLFPAAKKKPLKT